MATVAENVPFGNFSKLCQKISDGKGRAKKTQPLVEFVKYWREFHNKLHVENSTTTDSFFPALRLLIPQCERQRAAYGIKEVTLAKLLVEILCLDKNGIDAQKLINYRAPKSGSSEACDFASVAYFVLKNRSPEKGTFNLHDINNYLDAIAEKNATKNKDDLKSDLLHLFRNTSALEQKWLIRIILKDMKLGISENSVFKLFHLDAKSLYDVTNSLEKVCVSLRNPEIRLNEIEISLFTPFRPMLSEMALPNQVEQLMNNDTFIIETKFDGERLQLHKDGDSYMYFSRRGFDCTAFYGCSPQQGSLTPFIHKSFEDSVEQCILDGEIVIYSNKLKCIVSKGENADIQAMEPDGDYEPCFCVFDVLLLNDKILTNTPLKQRTALIRRIFNAIPNKIRYSEQLIASTNVEVAGELNKAIDNFLEGIVVKNPNSVYKPNVRKGGGWLKVKPEYIEGAMTELDLLIIGGYFGEGRRSGIVSQFLLGLASDEKTDGVPKHFLALCKVGSGYKNKELYELEGRIGDNWRYFNPKKCPKCLIVTGIKRKEQPDLWIEPSKSQILQIKATEINYSDGFPTKCTLRFPRVVKIRYDKPWHDCMTISELNDIKNFARGRLANKSIGSDEEPSPKKQKIVKEKTVTLAPHFRPTDTSCVQKISDMFKDKEFCMIFGSLEMKQKMETLIVEHGGKCVQNPGKNTFCVICDKMTAKVNNIISTGSYDVINCNWINNCVEKDSLLSWVPEDFLHATPQTMEKIGQDFDRFGDSYTEDITEDGLQKIFAKIQQQDWEARNITHEEISNIEQTYFQNNCPYSIFRNCCFYMKVEENEQELSSEKISKSKLLKSLIQMYGGRISPTVSSETTHIILFESDVDSMENKSDDGEKEKIEVSEKWVFTCIKEGKLHEAFLFDQCDSDDTLFSS